MREKQKEEAAKVQDKGESKAQKRVTRKYERKIRDREKTKE